MCGIVGGWNLGGPPALEAMSRAVRHRGPDDCGAWSQGQVSLAHRRLSIQDVSSRGRQPLLDPSGRVALVYNGELYEFREERERLEARGVTFRTGTDTEVLLQLYLEGGLSALPRLEGMFAFALWDQAEQMLLLARDPWGIKPLYVSEATGRFAFASELKALLKLPWVARDLDHDAILDYVRYLWSPAPRTPLRGVRKLPPGEAWIVREGRVTRRWRYREVSPGTERWCGTFPQAVAQTRDTLRRAVERQLVSDVEVGAFLSGGVDSSGLVAIAKTLRPHWPGRCFTIRTRQRSSQAGFSDDLPYARQVASELGVPLEEVDEEELRQELPELLFQLDEPTADPAALAQRTIARRASERGVKVLLSGTGGDDVFGGYRRHLVAHWSRLWSWLPLDGRRGLSRLSERLPIRSPRVRRLRKLLSSLGSNPLEEIARLYHWVEPKVLLEVSAPPLRARLTEGPPEPLLESLQSLPHGLSALDRMQHLDLRHFLADHNLNYGDKMSMAHGVEVRVPYLASEVVALGLSLPESFRVRGLETKRVLREALRPYLPPAVLDRPKTGFGAPLRGLSEQTFGPLLDEMLSRDRLLERGLFDPEAIHALRARTRAGGSDGTWTLFALLCIEMWLERTLSVTPLTPA